MIPEAKEVRGITAKHLKGDGFVDAKLYVIEERMGLWRKLTAATAKGHQNGAVAATGDPSQPILCTFSISLVFDRAVMTAGYGIPSAGEAVTEETAEGEAEAALASVNAEPEPTSVA